MGGGGRILANHNGQVKPNSSSPYVLKSGDSYFRKKMFKECCPLTKAKLHIQGLLRF